MFKRIKTAVIAFLNGNCKFIMEPYYKWRYDEDICEVLLLLHKYQELGGIERKVLVSILSSYEGWNLQRAVFAWGYCVYCGFIDCKPVVKEE